MKKFPVSILSAVLILLSFSRGFAQESIMNDIDYPLLQKLINSAKQNYFQVKVKQAQVDVAKTTYNQTKIAWFDALSFSYIYNPQNSVNLTSNNSVASNGTTVATGNSVNPNLFQGYQAAATLNIGNLLRNPFNTKNAKANYNIAVLEQEGYVASLETQVRRLYLTFVQASASVRMRTQSAQDVSTLLTQTKKRFEQGTITVDQYSSAVTAFATANQTKIDAEAAVLIAKTALEEIVGKKLEDIR